MFFKAFSKYPPPPRKIPGYGSVREGRGVSDWMKKIRNRIIFFNTFLSVQYQDIPSDNDSYAGGDSSSDGEFVPEEDNHNHSPEEQSVTPQVTECVSDSSDSERDEETTLPLQKVPVWSTKNRMSPPLIFSHDCGLPPDILAINNITPFGVFSLLWTPEWIDKIVFETNLYAQQENKRYVPTTDKEMRAFLGLNLLMGLKRSPSYRDYWSSAPDLNDPFISKVMTVNRFGWLLSHLHLNDNCLQPERDDPTFDKLYKVRPLLSEISRTFAQHYLPTEYLAIDESMIKFKGRSSLKQYMPKKPVKRGYKVWMLCASTGYNLKFQIYTGKSNDGVERDLGARVVKTLVDDLAGKYHRVFFDNYFTSYYLLKDLAEAGIYACGTVNASRKHLPNLKSDKMMKRGDTDYSVSNDKLCCLKWRDKRTVHLLSNFHDPADEVQVNRKEKDGAITKVNCPAALQEYNKNMNFVDKFDQLKGQYEVDRKSRKWWHRIFFHLLDCSVVNAFIIFREHAGSEKMTLKDFRRSLVRQMTAEALLDPTDKRKSSVGAGAELKKFKPFVDFAMRTTASNHQPTRCSPRRCANCSTKAHPSRTIWMCQTCNVPLCLRKEKNCFSEFHKK